MATIHATFSEDKRFSARFRDGEQFPAHFGEIQYVRVAEWYDGDYTVTPAEYAQELHTQGKTFAQNFIIEPIPSNYGKITWNGSTLTVS